MLHQNINELIVPEEQHHHQQFSNLGMPAVFCIIFKDDIGELLQRVNICVEVVNVRLQI